MFRKKGAKNVIKHAFFPPAHRIAEFLLCIVKLTASLPPVSLTKQYPISGCRRQLAAGGEAAAV